MSKTMLQQIINELVLIKDVLGDNTKQIGDIQSKLDEHSQKFGDIEGKLDKHSHMFIDLENKVDQNTTAIEEMNVKVSNLEVNMEEVNEKLNRNFKQIVQNSENITAVTLNNERQNKILETLALRSIEHESELRKL